MTSRERILAAINHKQPDKIPIDLGSTPSSGISAVAYRNLLDHLGIKGTTRIYDVVQQLAQPEDAIIEKFNVDALDIGRTFNAQDNDWYDIQLLNGKPAQYPVWFRPTSTADGAHCIIDEDGTCLAKMAQNSTFFDQTFFPYQDGYPENFSDLPHVMNKVMWASQAHSPWDHAHEADFWQQLRQRTLALRDNTDKALVIVCGCNLFEWGTFLRRMDQFLMDLLTAPDTVEKLLDALLEIHLATLDKVCTAVGDIVDVIRFGDDLGMDNGPFMSKETYQQLFKPRHKILCDYVKTHSSMHTFLHSCGSIYQLLPDLIEAGFEIFNPVQTNCVDMEPEQLKSEFGQDVTFWGGGIDTRHVLNKAEPAEIRDHVLERLAIFSPGGGFIFTPIHNILPEVPPENIIAMFEAVEDFNNNMGKR